MANHLDLEEQEQRDQFMYFWKQYGKLILIGLAIIVIAAVSWISFASWKYEQSIQAASMFDEVERSIATGDVAKVERALSDMNAKFGSNSYAHQAGLLAAKMFYEKGNLDASKKALATVVEKSPDIGYQAIAKLRLASALIDGKNYEDAMKQLSGAYPKEFEPMAADRRGDVLALQGKPAEAKAEYVKAYKGFDDKSGYRRLVEVKLNALGGDPVTSPTTELAAKDAAVEQKK
jgi:predicted negative regulator of RcsB-dependent stress response